MKRAIEITFLAVLVAGSFAGGAQRSFAAEPLGPQEIPGLLQKLAPQTAGRAVVTAAESPRFSLTKDGFLRYIGAPPGQHFPPAIALAAQSPEQTARRFMQENARLFGVPGANASFITKRNRQGSGRSYIRLQQSYHNLPVVAAEAVVQVDNLGGVECVLGDLASGIASLESDSIPVTATLSAEEAATRARAAFPIVPPGEITAATPVLSIFAPSVMDEEGEPVLVWDMNLSCDTATDPNARVLVNATNGQVVRIWTLVHSALSRKIYDANSTTNDPGTLVRPEGQPPSGVPDADNAYDFLGDTYNFYFSTHGRDSLDAAGLVLSGTVRYCEPNGSNAPFCPPRALAFYSNGRMYFGLGIIADDVTAHELTHGVTGFESGLIYANASGAINESFSDVWGEFVDLTNGRGTDTAAVRWQMGEDLTTGPIRDMKFPRNFNHPDRLSSSFYVAPTNNPTITNDFGGVHSNSGVNNKLCYLLTDGDTFNGQTIVGKGIPMVAALYYEVQVHLLTSSANWTELYNSLTQAAINLGWSVADRNNLYRACLAVEIANPGRDWFVDKSSLCSAHDGSANCVPNLIGPFLTVGQAVNAAWSGDNVVIRSGTYNEPMTVQKILTLNAENGPVTIGQ